MDTPATWAVRQLNATAAMIPEGSPYAWVKAKVANCGVEIEALAEKFERDNQADKDAAGANSSGP